MKIHHLITTLLFASAAAIASPGEEHSHAPEKSHAEVTIPATLSELWVAIEREQTALVAALEKKDGIAGHNIAETLMGYANALSEKVTGLDEAILKRISGQAKNLAHVYNDIHHAVEDAAFEQASKDATKASAVLKLLKPQLPLKN